MLLSYRSSSGLGKRGAIESSSSNRCHECGPGSKTNLPLQARDRNFHGMLVLTTAILLASGPPLAWPSICAPLTLRVLNTACLL